MRQVIQGGSRSSVRPQLFHLLSIMALLLSAAVNAGAGVPIDEAAKALPDKIETFQALGPAQTPAPDPFEKMTGEVGAISSASRIYGENKKPFFLAALIRTRTDSGAYALLTRLPSGNSEMKIDVVGIASFISPNHIVFCKGTNLVQVEHTAGSSATQEQLLLFARAFAATLEAGDDELPVLVKHLPEWQTKIDRATYAVSLESLKSIVPNQQALLESISFEGETEAVAANYGPSQLVIVEFATPQLAGDNDRRITPKIEELRGQGQSVPAYRRVGNYSVFVFNAPDEQTANQLIDQVKYEKVVRWLGDNPNWYEKAVREWAQTSAGVFMAVLKSSGLSMLICLGIGGTIGVLLFRRRRALQNHAAIYSDAGGMVRLDLEEVTAISDSARLLSEGTRKH